MLWIQNGRAYIILRTIEKIYKKNWIIDILFSFIINNQIILKILYIHPIYNYL
jgi:hypothetical protein